MKLHLFYLLTLFVMMYSCTIQKRVYRPGYHVEWNSNKKLFSKSDYQSLDIKEIDLEEQSQGVSNSPLSENELKQNEIKALDKSSFVEQSDELNVSQSDLQTRNQGFFAENEISKEINPIESKTESKAPADDNRGLKVGWSLILLGLIFAALAIIFYIYLGGLGYFFAIVFSLMSLVLLVGAILFLILDV